MQSSILEAMRFGNELKEFVDGQNGKNDSERLEAADKLIDQIAGFLTRAGGTAEELKKACRLAVGQQPEEQAA